MNIYSHYENAMEARPDPAGGPILVETAGYIPKEIQLQMLLDSGAALEAYNKARFPNMIPDDEIDEPEYDPTIQKGYDYFDYANDSAVVKSNMTRKLAELEMRKATEKAAAAADSVDKPDTLSGSASVTTPPVSAGGSGGGQLPS